MSLNHAQTEAVAHNKGPCMVLAGPGSGKTLTIAKRIEYLIMKHKVRPEEILVITFTKYAAWEMKNRTRSICGPSSYAVTFGTFHGIYYGILKWAYRLNQSNLLSDEEKYRILREILPGIDWDQEPEADEEKDYLIYADTTTDKPFELTPGLILKRSRRSKVKYYAKVLWFNRKKITWERIVFNVKGMLNYKK